MAEPYTNSVGDRSELAAALEALLFAADRPLELSDLAAWTGFESDDVAAELHRLQGALEGPDRGIRLVKEAGGWRLLSKPEWGPLIMRAFHGEQEPRPLSRAALEVLAIVAYRQPITRVAVDEIRGVRSERMMARLVDEGLIEIAGRSDTIGRPLLYRTTPRFLEFVGLESLDQLPPLGDGEMPGGLHIRPDSGPR